MHSMQAIPDDMSKIKITTLKGHEHIGTYHNGRLLQEKAGHIEVGDAPAGWDYVTEEIKTENGN